MKMVRTSSGWLWCSETGDIHESSEPYLKRGVMIAVGAAFKFYSGTDVKRAPHWMVKMHLEFVYRIFSEPKKQLKRCGWIVYTLPGLLYREWRKK